MDDYTVKDLGDLIVEHKVENLRVTFRKNKYEINWMQTGKPRTQVEDADFCTAMTQFVNKVRADAQN